MDRFVIPGLNMLGQPRLGSVYDETGTPDSGYSEEGPYSCAQCIHKLAKDLPLCIHPKVVGDHDLQDKLVEINGRLAVKINLERGCCKYVRPPANHAEPDEDDNG